MCANHVGSVRLRARGYWKWALLGVFLFASCNPMRGCAESDFDLAPESRLPSWFTVPPGLGRSDVNVLMTYYVSLFGTERRTARFELRDNAGRQLAQVEGKERGTHPFALEPIPPAGPLPYPLYEVVTINGVTEVIEHRQREPRFYITDDPNVKRRLGVTP